MLLVRYPEADCIVYTDLNAEKESGIGKKFFNELSSASWAVLVQPQPTRIGYGDQSDSIIDYFFVSAPLAASAAAMSAEV